MLFLPDGGTPAPDQSISGTPPHYPIDKTITAGAANTKGSWTALLSPVPRGGDYVTFAFTSTGAAGVNHTMAVDIALAADANSIIIPNLLVSRLVTQDANFQATPFMLSLPMRIPRGAALYARCQSSQASRTMSAGAWISQSGKKHPDHASYIRCDAYGVNVSGATVGTTHTSGNSSSFSTPVNFGSTLSRDYSAIMLVTDGRPSTAATSLAYTVDLKISGITVARNYAMISNNEDRFIFQVKPFARPLASGSQMQITGACSGTAEQLEFAAYCFY